MEEIKIKLKKIEIEELGNSPEDNMRYVKYYEGSEEASEFLKEESEHLEDFVLKKFTIKEYIISLLGHKLSENRVKYYSLKEDEKNFENYMDKHLEGIEEPKVYLEKLSASVYKKQYATLNNCETIEDIPEELFNGVISKYHLDTESIPLLKYIYMDFIIENFNYIANSMLKINNEEMII